MTATSVGAYNSSTERVQRQQQNQAHTAAPPSTYDGHNRRAQQLHRARTTATTVGAHSSSTERVRRQRQYQARTAAPPSAYDGHISRRVQQLHRARTTATTKSGSHSSSTEYVRRPQQARTAAPPSAYDGHNNIGHTQQLGITEGLQKRRESEEKGVPVISYKPRTTTSSE